MSDEEEIDIANSLGLLNDDSSSEVDDSSNSDVDSEAGVADIIDYSDDEAPEVKTPKAKNEVTESTFPRLELSDSEEEENNNEDNIKEFFADNTITQAKKAKSGTFQSFGFSKFLLRNIARKGYKQPTPIQRKTIPMIMADRDVVGMARTGSGKTAAFTLPVIEKLRSHSSKTGIRAIVLSPSRELALQTFKQVKEFTKGTDLRTNVLIGGDSLEEQFTSMMSNPDIVIATPGRFMHLQVEMDLDLKTVEYVVFDEADRLFEMGFAEQLNILLTALPSSRQSLLFSATLPRTLVEFAKAGLTNPVLVRLDAETKVSDQLQMAFITTKKNEREANLLFILQEVIKMPVATESEIRKVEDQNKYDDDSESDENRNSKDKKKPKRKHVKLSSNSLPSPHSTIIFVPTKHHVEYIAMLLKDANFLVSAIYGTLDMHARKQQLDVFRRGITSILVVTDVAARGIDIPILANVINFTLPASSKIFIHRVGRTARAGNKGWAYTIASAKEIPYLLDLELFLGKKILLTEMHDKKCELLREKQGDSYIEPAVSYTDRLVLGSAPRVALETYQDLYENIFKNHYELRVVREVATKGEKLYHRTRQAASQESVKRAKELLSVENWDDQHLLFGSNLEKEKEKFLAKLGERKSKETVFEFLKKGNDKDENSLVDFMNRRRRQIAPIQRRAKERRDLLEKERLAGLNHGIADQILANDSEVGYKTSNVDIDEKELMENFEDADKILQKNTKKKSYRDEQYFMSHYAPASEIQDQQLSISSSFVNDAAVASFDLDNDEKVQVQKQVMKWDKKKGKYINSKSTDSKKYIIGENGQRIPASLKSGRFEDWKKSRKHVAVDVGNTSEKGPSKRFKHNKTSAPKTPDKFRDDYLKQKKKVDNAINSGQSVKGYNRPGQKQEIKSTEDIRKARLLKEKRRAKNARPSKKSRK